MSVRLRPISREVLVLLHRENVAEHGGADGLREPGLLEAALEYPRARALSGQADIAALAAAHALGVLKYQPFIDGNKRAAFLAAGLFLRLNGWNIAASAGDAADVMLGVATGKLDEASFADWIRARL